MSLYIFRKKVVAKSEEVIYNKEVCYTPLFVFSRKREQGLD